MRLPRYRVWAGFTIWIGASVLDLIFVRSGLVSFAGFVVAFVWSWKSPA